MNKLTYPDIKKKQKKHQKTHKKPQNNKQKNHKQTKKPQKTVLGRRGKLNKKTGVLERQHKCQQTINKPGCLVVKTFFNEIFFFH